MRTIPLFALAALALGCTAPTDGDLVLEHGGEVLEADLGDEKEDRLAYPFTPFSDDVSRIGDAESRRLFTSAASYRAFFGHDAPGVNFGAEWVFFYSAGVKPTGGYEAAVAAILPSPAGSTLKVTTRLESPGQGCAVTRALTRPTALVKFRIPPRRTPYLALYRSDLVRSCAAPAECKVDADCRVVADYCTTCSCNALAPGRSPAACGGPGVRCFVDPCLGKRPLCAAGRCVVTTP